MKHRNSWSIVCCLLTTCIASAPLKAEALSSTYLEVLGALQGGKNVRLIVDLNRCTEADSGRPGPAVQGGVFISAFKVTLQRGLSFANAHQTLDDSGRPVTEYIRHNLSPDGKLTVRASKLAAGMVEPENQGEFLCEVPRGAKFVW